MTPERIVYALIGLAEHVLTRIASKMLPWSNRSQHDAYLHGYKDGIKDAQVRRSLRL